MSNSIRKIEREVIKNNLYKQRNSKKAFRDEWKEYREKKFTDAEGNVQVPRNTMKNGLHFNDNPKNLIQSVKNMFNIKKMLQDAIDRKNSKVKEEQ